MPEIGLILIQASGFGGRVLLVLIGIALTLITQSSSAIVAASLTALKLQRPADIGLL